jgi:nitrous oxidase accessory protein
MSPSWRKAALFSGLAVGLVALAFWLPLWTMTLEAPQYPADLHLRAYGNRIEGDLREINIINHYVGMATIPTAPAPEMRLFPYAIAALVLLAAAAAFHRKLRRLAIAAILVVAAGILVDLQLWLHTFGRNLKPEAPIRVEPFTPLAIGSSRVGNFETHAMVSWGYGSLLGAALALYWGGRGRPRRSVQPLEKAAALLLAAGPSLQARIDAAAPGATIEVHGGLHPGPIVIHGPLTLLGIDRPVIDGGGSGSVVSIEGDSVVLRGFVIRGSGRHVSEEAAGIKARGSGHLIEGNEIEDVYFGIHLSDGSRNVVRHNQIVPGDHRGERPGHGVSLWYERDAEVTSNAISHARDGIYLSYADNVRVEDNEIFDSRYGLHSMNSLRSNFERNRLQRNLLGAALMYSQEIVLRGNRIEDHREGATAYGVLLKDIGGLSLQDNRIIGNRVGIYADGVPIGRGHEALVRRNILAGNDTALALQSNVRLTFVENRVEANLAAVRSEGSELVANVWSQNGRGNHWDDYRGFDRNGDGIGDLPYRYEAVLNDMIRREPLTRAFLFTPAHLALESAARLFPVFRPAPLVVDEHPLMAPPAAGGNR